MSAVSSIAPVAATPDLTRAYARCAEITRARARNFHYGIRLSPEPQRSALHAVYAWMRSADDLVDADRGSDAAAIERELHAFRHRTDAALSGQPPDDDLMWLALSDCARRSRLAPEHFHDMLDGQLDDARRRTYDTYDELVEYCRRVASTVGLICVEIWGYSDPRAIELAAERGIAFQMTNIIRDFAEDFDAGRVYLPAEDFQRHGLAPAQLRQWSNPQACQAVMGANIRRAAIAYERSAALDELVGPSGQPTLWAMTAIYRRLLDKIASHPKRVATGERMRVSSLHKGAIALRARWQTHRSNSSLNAASRGAGTPV